MNRGPPQTAALVSEDPRDMLGLGPKERKSLDPLSAFMSEPSAVPQARPAAARPAPPLRPKPQAAAAAARQKPSTDPLGLGYIASSSSASGVPSLGPGAASPAASSAARAAARPAARPVSASRPPPPPRPPRSAPGNPSTPSSGRAKLAHNFFASLGAAAQPAPPLDPAAVPRTGEGLRAWAAAGAWAHAAALGDELVDLDFEPSGRGNADGRSPRMRSVLLRAVALAQLGDTAKLAATYKALSEPHIASLERSGTDRAATDAAIAEGRDAMPFALLVLHAQAVAGTNPRNAFERVERLLALLNGRAAAASEVTMDRRPYLEPLELPLLELSAGTLVWWRDQLTLIKASLCASLEQPVLALRLCEGILRDSSSTASTERSLTILGAMLRTHLQFGCIDEAGAVLAEMVRPTPPLPLPPLLLLLLLLQQAQSLSTSSPPPPPPPPR